MKWPDGTEHRLTDLKAGGIYAIDCAEDEPIVTRSN